MLQICLIFFGLKKSGFELKKREKNFLFFTRKMTEEKRKQSSEMTTFNILSIILDHCGSKNVQRLLKYKNATKECEFLEQLELHKENARNWCKLSPRTLIVVTKTLQELEKIGLNPSYAESSIGNDFPNFWSDIKSANYPWMSEDYLTDQIRMVCCCFASLGYNVRFWEDNPRGVCLSIYSKHEHMESEAELSKKYGYERFFTDYLSTPDLTPVVLKNNCDSNYVSPLYDVTPIYDQRMLPYDDSQEDDEL